MIRITIALDTGPHDVPRGEVVFHMSDDGRFVSDDSWHMVGGSCWMEEDGNAGSCGLDMLIHRAQERAAEEDYDE